VSSPRFVVHTDIFLEHLYGHRRPSVLRMATGRFFCYTTVFNAIELFAHARNEHERQVIADSMAALKVLGLNPKNALRYAGLLREHPRKNRLHLLVAGLCIESKLPLLTDAKNDFAGIGGLRLVSPDAVLKQGSATASP
jgi:predicted nucleic acid-binding protein